MISTGGSFFSGWRMVRFLTTILPKSAERRKPPLSPHTSKKRNFKKKNPRSVPRGSTAYVNSPGFDSLCQPGDLFLRRLWQIQSTSGEPNRYHDGAEYPTRIL